MSLAHFDSGSLGKSYLEMSGVYEAIHNKVSRLEPLHALEGEAPPDHDVSPSLVASVRLPLAASKA